MKPGDLYFVRGYVIIAEALDYFEKVRGSTIALTKGSPFIAMKSFIVTNENKNPIMVWKILCAHGVYYARELTVKSRSSAA